MQHYECTYKNQVQRGKFHIARLTKKVSTLAIITTAQSKHLLQSIIYPSEKKKIIGTTSILTWGKSRVFPTDPPFTLDILSSLYREKYMYTKSQRLFPTFLSGAKIFGHVSLSTSCLPSLYVVLDFKTVGFFSNTVSQYRDCFAVYS